MSGEKSVRSLINKRGTLGLRGRRADFVRGGGVMDAPSLQAPSVRLAGAVST